MRKRDGLDRAGRLTHVDDVADAVLVLDEHEDAGQEVLHEALRTEAERDPGDACAGDQRSEVDAELAQDRHACDQPDHKRGDAAQHQTDRLRPGGRAQGDLAGVEHARHLLADACAPQPLLEAPVGRVLAAHGGDEAPDQAADDQVDQPRDEQDQQDRQQLADHQVGELGPVGAVGPPEHLPADERRVVAAGCRERRPGPGPATARGATLSSDRQPGTAKRRRAMWCTLNRFTLLT